MNVALAKVIRQKSLQNLLNEEPVPTQVLSKQIINLDVDDLTVLRKHYPFYPIHGYLNINSLGNKTDALRVVLNKALSDILCVDEMKLNESFTDSQLKKNGYQFPLFRRDRDNRERGKIIFVRNGLIVNRLKKFEIKKLETIFLDLTIMSKKWPIVFGKMLFEELSDSLNRTIIGFKNTVLIGDLNINVLDKGKSNH